jgi:DNA-binding response OmpR family regulator
MAVNPIVWMDDDLDYMRLVRRALRLNGVSNPTLHVQGHETARSYLGALDDNNRSDFSPCLVVIEARAPRVDSMLLVSWIRNRPTFATVPLVLLDAESGLDVQKSKELGATEVLVKAFHREAIDLLVSRITREWL